MRGSFKQKSSLNKENKAQLSHYSFSKNIKSQIIDKATRKSNNFVDRVNGYIQMISPHVTCNRKASKDSKGTVSNHTKKLNSNHKQQQVNRQRLAQKVRGQREMNRNLQKCIIEIQKILWQRNDRLEQLQQQLRDHQKMLNRKKSIEQEEASDYSCKRIKQSQKDLKKHIKTLGMRQILNNMDNMEESSNQQEFSHRNITESSCSLEPNNSYIKIRRPRTESESEAAVSRRQRRPS